MTDEITLDPAVARGIELDLATAAHALDDEQRRITSRVGSLLAGGWSGRAADAFADGWSEWSQGAGDVVGALDAMQRLIGTARVDISGADDSAAGASQRLQSRLGPS